MSRALATVGTSLISTLAHESVMFCITKKLRGYGFICQMLQLSIIVIQRSRFMRDQLLLNNIMFWISMIWGLSMLGLPWRFDVVSRVKHFYFRVAHSIRILYEDVKD